MGSDGVDLKQEVNLYHALVAVVTPLQKKGRVDQEFRKLRGIFGEFEIFTLLSVSGMAMAMAMASFLPVHPQKDISSWNAHICFFQPVNYVRYAHLPQIFVPSRKSLGSRIGLTFRRNDDKFVALGSIEASWKSSNEGKILQASTMEQVYEILTDRLLSAAMATPPSSKYIVGLAGPPGAGKSTVAKEITKRVNTLWSQRKEGINVEIDSDIAISLPMDGFHLYRSQLNMMENPAEAHARRGAPWTFDPEGLIKCLNVLRTQGWVHAPSFDHGVGDPKENDIFVSSLHRVVVVEGNYLLLVDDKWKGLAEIFDERWFLDIDINATLKRVFQRFIMLGIPPDKAQARVDYNDRKNAELILETKPFADLIIPSVNSEKYR